MLLPSRLSRSRAILIQWSGAGGDQEVPDGRNAVLQRRSQDPLDAVLVLDASTFSLGHLAQDGGHPSAIASRDRMQQVPVSRHIVRAAPERPFCFARTQPYSSPDHVCIDRSRCTR
jgi:hypothetical protein